VAKQTIRDLDVAGKKVLVRVDFNVPLDKKTGAIGDDRRIRAALPTLQHILDRGGSLILITHLGRPTGDPEADAAFRLDPIADRLAQLIGRPVVKANDTVGPEAQKAAAELPPGGVLLLENVRFNKAEKVPKKDEATGKPDEKAVARHREFAAALAALGDAYVNDAFGTCHRDEASMVALAEQFPPDRRALGFLVEKEVKILHDLLGAPRHPFVALMGGAKVSTKLALIKNLLPLVDKLLIGGAMTYTFMLAQGRKTGASLVEPELVDTARELLAAAGSKIELPKDTVIGKPDDPAAGTRVIPAGQDIPDGWEGFDIGPATREHYAAIVRSAATVVWNGPMGRFEVKPYDEGTLAIAQALAECPGVTAVGGGETAEAVEKLGVADRVTHVSTGGGAFLESLEGKQFNSLRVIPDR
jgi:phosphoglycerate kinase